MAPKQRAKTPRRLLIIALSAVLALVFIGTGAIYVFARSITSDAVPIVTLAPSSTVSSVPTPLPTPDLPLISGEPTDIGEDVDAPLPTGTAVPAPSPTVEPIYERVPIQGDVFNILIVGQDIRPNQSGRGRSDTMMILSYDRKAGKAGVVSLMRDTWVPIKGHGWNRLNATYVFGGVGLTINTINNLFDLDIQNYIIVNFEGMTGLVDKLGGVDVEITEVEAKYYNKNFGWGISAGRRHLDGAKALVHARNRKSNGGDFERVRRQQDIMLAVYEKVAAIRDPIMLGELTKFMMGNIKTNLPAETLFSMGLEIADRGGIEIERGRVPVDKTWRYANKDGRSVITIDMKRNAEYLHQLIYDEK